MTELIVTLVRRFIKKSVINDFLATDVLNINSQIPLLTIEIGVKRKLLSKTSNKKSSK